MCPLFILSLGSETISAIECPNTLLFTGDYTYTNGSGAVACDTTADVIDVCSNTSQVLFNYTTCAQKIAFSGKCPKTKALPVMKHSLLSSS